MPQRQFPTRVRSFRIAAALALASAIAGCSIWDLGPEPSNYVGPDGTPKKMTDADLQAVTPVVPGDRPGGGAPLPGSMVGTTTVPQTQPATQAATATAPAATEPAVPGEIPNKFSVQDAILVGLENNVALRVQRFNVPIQRTSEETNLAKFDPTVNFSLQGGRAETGIGATSRPATQPATRPRTVNNVDSVDGKVSVDETLPTGTTISAGISTSNRFYSDSVETAGLNLSVTQSLLRGAGLDVNLASLRSAQISTKITQYELRGTAESLVAQIESAYWDLAYAEQQMVIVQNGLDVAQKQLDDTNRRIEVGALSPSERPAAEAVVATRREDLINAASTLETARMTFLRLITPAGKPFWDKTVNLTTLPFIPTGAMDPVETHVQVAMKMRPDVNEAKLEIQRGDLQVVVTKNGLLPRLDMFLQLGNTGLASSFGQSFSHLNGPDYSAILGIQGDWEPINRSARASYLSAQLSRDQLQQTLENTYQTVELDVRSAYIEVQRTRQQIDASRASRIAGEATLQVEQQKLAAGNGTSLNVAIAQGTLLSDQLAEVQAVTNHLKALVDLYSKEGTLLLRRGLDAPGATPVPGFDPKLLPEMAAKPTP